MPKHDTPEALTEEQVAARMVMKYAPMVGMRNHDNQLHQTYRYHHERRTSPLAVVISHVPLFKVSGGKSSVL